MGADLYIEKVRKTLEDEWQPKFDEAIKLLDTAIDNEAKMAAQKLVVEAYNKLYSDGYFRDSYNSTSVLRRLGLSWWQDLEYDIDAEESGNNISAEACQRFLDKVLAADLNLPAREELIANNAKVDSVNTVEAWHEFYRDKRERLIKFLQQAIEHGGMYASC